MFTILFVCTGNTCRSSMAEALAKKILEQYEDKNAIKVISAGTSAVEGCPATPEAVEVMRQKGIDLSKHTSRPLTIEMAREADLILTMTEAQKEFVLKMLPSAYGRVHTIKEYILEGYGSEEDLEELAEYLNKLELREYEFYTKYGEQIEELKAEYNEYAKKLREIEEKLLTFEEELAESTRELREKIAFFNRGKPKREISDPYGQNIEVYQSCADELEDNIKKALSRFLSEIE